MLPGGADEAPEIRPSACWGAVEVISRVKAARQGDGAVLPGLVSNTLHGDERFDVAECEDIEI